MSHYTDEPQDRDLMRLQADLAYVRQSTEHLESVTHGATSRIARFLAALRPARHHGRQPASAAVTSAASTVGSLR